jgi:hypothetical protein
MPKKLGNGLEELVKYPPLPEEHIGYEENVVWNGEEWEYLPID